MIVDEAARVVLLVAKVAVVAAVSADAAVHAVIATEEPTLVSAVPPPTETLASSVPVTDALTEAPPLSSFLY